MNAFDKIATDQKKMRETAHDIYFWLKFAGKNLGVVTLEEREKIFHWLMKHDSTVDKTGDIRCKIIRSIPLNAIRALADVYEFEELPKKLKVIIRKRLNSSC